MTHDFLSCDWGTTGFRLRLVAGDTLAVRADLRRPEGVGQLGVTAGMDEGARAALYADHWRARVAELAAQAEAPLAALPAVISGMASANVGWRELPYATCPFRLDGADLRWQRLAATAAGGQEGGVFLLSGLRSADDIMRGEETQAIGLLADPALAAVAAEGVLIQPGTHSKHLRLRDGAIIDCQTYMTGELYAVLGQHSLLRHSLAGASFSLPADEGPFRAGVRLGLTRELGHALFAVRTGQVLAGRAGAAAAATLSGLLLGGELRGLAHHHPAPTPLLLAASAPLDGLYRAAAEEAGLAGRLTVAPAAALDRATIAAHARFLARHRA